MEEVNVVLSPKMVVYKPISPESVIIYTATTCKSETSISNRQQYLDRRIDQRAEVEFESLVFINIYCTLRELIRFG